MHFSYTFPIYAERVNRCLADKAVYRFKILIVSDATDILLHSATSGIGSETDIINFVLRNLLIVTSILPSMV